MGLWGIPAAAALCALLLTGACVQQTDGEAMAGRPAAGMTPFPTDTEDNSCRFAMNGVCDEPVIGTGMCGARTDAQDCRPVAFLRDRDNSCATAFNNICEERAFGGSGACPSLTDTADCIGRQTAEGVRDHFFGEDDRVRVDPAHMPWRAVGQLALANGQSCTATLVGPDIALTAAHCLQNGPAGTPAAPTAFYLGRQGERYAARAGVAAFAASPDYRGRTRAPGVDGGRDYGFVALDRPLGDQFGWVEVQIPGSADFALAASAGRRVTQGGYSWDSGGALSAHYGCRVTAFLEDNAIFHECDTTLGDSGSPLFSELPGGGHALIAINSQFHAAEPGAPARNLGVDARAFAEPLAAFAARHGGAATLAAR